MCPKNYMNLPFIWFKNLGGTFVRFVPIHACDGQTDGQTDRHLCDRKDRVAYMQRGKNVGLLKSKIADSRSADKEKFDRGRPNSIGVLCIDYCRTVSQYDLL